MARLTRKFLTALGIEDENVQDQIISAHTETTDALKEQRDSYKADAEKLPDVQKELDKLKTADNYKDLYDQLQNEFTAYKTEQAEKETVAKKKSAYRGLLEQAGVSENSIDAVLKVSDVNAIEFDENGGVKDAEQTVESIKSEWAGFIKKATEKGAQVANPPANSGKTITREEILKIKDTSERQKAIADNLELFRR